MTNQKERDINGGSLSVPYPTYSNTPPSPTHYPFQRVLIEPLANIIVSTSLYAYLLQSYRLCIYMIRRHMSAQQIELQLAIWLQSLWCVCCKEWCWWWQRQDYMWSEHGRGIWRRHFALCIKWRQTQFVIAFNWSTLFVVIAGGFFCLFNVLYD